MSAPPSKRAASHQLSEGRCKRSRLDTKGALTLARARPSRLESLPTEIVETIFLGSRNGNPLLAAPRVAVQLSGNEFLNRAIFALAFYNHNLRHVSNVLHLTSLLPDPELQMDIWDVRSLSKAALRAKWCTCGWVSTFVDVLARHRIAPREDSKTLEEERRVQLQTETRFLQCTLWSIAGDLDRKILEYQNMERPLKSVLENSLMGTNCPRTELSYDSKHGILWLPFESVDFDCDAIWDDDERSSTWLSAWMATDYYLYPEDSPFKISPSIYRRAAIRDLGSDLNEIGTGSIESYALISVAQLFLLDPRSLPRTDPILLLWACATKLDLETYSEMWEDSRQALAHIDANDLPHPPDQKDRVRSTFIYQTHLDVLRYIKDGSLRSTSKGDGFDIGARLTPCRDEKHLHQDNPEVRSGIDDELILRGAIPPAYGDFSFLSNGDFANDGDQNIDLYGFVTKRTKQGLERWNEEARCGNSQYTPLPKYSFDEVSTFDYDPSSDGEDPFDDPAVRSMNPRISDEAIVANLKLSLPTWHRTESVSYLTSFSRCARRRSTSN